MALVYVPDSELREKSYKLFPNNETYRLKWMENIRYLRNCSKLALDTGGWIIDGGKFMPEFNFSVLKE